MFFEKNNLKKMNDTILQKMNLTNSTPEQKRYIVEMLIKNMKLVWQKIDSTKKASEVLKTDPILFKLRILSKTTINGILSVCLNSSTLMRFNSSLANFLIKLYFINCDFFNSKICINLYTQN